MSSYIRIAFCLVALISVIGCGGVKEEKPADKPPELTPEQKKNKEDQMKWMKEMQKKQGKKQR